MKNELKTTTCLEINSNTDVNFLNLHTDKVGKTYDEKQLYLITYFTNQALNRNYLLLTLNVTVQISHSELSISETLIHVYLYAWTIYTNHKL